MSRLFWLRRRMGQSFDGRIASALIALAVILGISTYAALRSAPPFGENPEVVVWLLNIDLIVLCGLAILIARRVVLLYSIWRKGIPGARLHLRLVYIFGILAMAPAIIMTVFSLFFFHYGVQTWFSDRVRTAVNEAQEVAEAYLREHQQVIRADILAMAKDLDNQSTLSIINPTAFAKFVETQSIIRNLPEVVIFDRNGGVLHNIGLSIGFQQSDVPDFAMDRADEGEVVLLTDVEDDRVRALVKLTNFPSTYLYVGRMVESNVLGHMQTTREAVQKYDEMSKHYLGLRTTVTLIYIVVALVLLLSAIWFAIVLARRLAQPIVQLIEASEKVRMGDFTTTISDQSGLEEFDFLNKSFNRMTRQLSDQREELVQANRRIDERRQFTETILAGVSSGVLSLDKSGIVTLANTSAGEILQKDIAGLIGKPIDTVLSGIKDTLEQGYLKPHKVHQTEISHVTRNGIRTLLVRVAIELLGEKDLGAVITFDDITTLQSAQRKAAWADVARRIAHEIKNPLTPIQLSAERLKRKYMDSLDPKDQDIFGQCINTIIRHVENIGHMVSEFSAFARLPDPVFKNCDITDIIGDGLVFYRQAHPDVKFLGLDRLNRQKGMIIRCDEQQIRQAFTNIMQNALDSLAETQKKTAISPKIGVWITRDDHNEIMISVNDNGGGLPENVDKDSLTEPYVTFKERGTGLGLAIVKKIMEDHRGRVVFTKPDQLDQIPEWEDLGGATVTLVIPDQKIE